MIAEYIVLAAASSALGLAAVRAELNLPFVILAACMPWLPTLFVFLRQALHLRQAPQFPSFLFLHPYGSCEISWPAENNRRSVEITQQWQHFFGLTLSLKILDCPHNKQETVRMTVWRCNIAPDIYRRMCVMVTWRLDQRQVEQKMETV